MIERDRPAAPLHSYGGPMVLAAIMLFAFSLRTAVTSLTPLLQRIGDDIGFGSAVIGVFGMLPTAMFALGGPLTPWLGRRIGLERTALAAVVATTVGIGVRPFVPGTAALLVLSCVALLGMGIGNVVLPPLVKRYFPGKVAAVSSGYLGCVQLGTTLPALTAVPLANAAGWQVSLAVWALVPLAALLPWIGVVWSRRLEDDDHTERTETTRPQQAGTVGSLWRSPVALGLAAMFGMTSLFTYSLFTWLPGILADAGGSDALGGNMVALFSATGLVATFLAPAACARLLNPFPVALACVGCILVGLAGLWFAPMTATWLWVGLLGLGPTTFPMALTLVNLRTRTDAGSARLSGFVQGLGYAAACLGPLLFGVLHDLTGEWHLPFVMLVGTSTVMLLGAYQACRPRFLEDTLR